MVASTSSDCEGSAILTLACSLTPDDEKNYRFAAQLADGGILTFARAERSGAWLRLFSPGPRTSTFASIAFFHDTTGIEVRLADVRMVAGGDLR